MRYAGTISIPDDIFKSVLEYTARSLKVHGFTDILFIGDSGGNQTGMEEVAEALNQEWDHERTRVHFISDWYSSAVTFRSMLKNQGETDETIGTHAGLYDTSLLLAVAPEHVRTEKMTQGKGMDIDGVIGDPTGASAEIGKIGMDIMHEAAMKQINRLIAEQ
jgi:creatinine amidohydrolase/Fe(II)-dependent formamide hydrolase-like protein